jgi:hypothetical protein
MGSLNDFSVADNHCLAFSPKASVITRDEFIQFFSLGGPSVSDSRTGVNAEEAADQVRSAVSFKSAIRLLSEFLGCERNLDSVIETRNKRSREFSNYLKELFGSVHLTHLVIDSGFHPIDLDEFKSYVPAHVAWVYRLEPLVKQLLETETKFDEFIRKFDEALLKGIQDGCVGFKTIIAYRTGLDISLTSEEDARTDFERMFRGHELTAWFGPVVKKLRDHLVCRATEICVKHDRVLQIHTGLGDTDIVGTKCNPILLEDFLKEDKVRPAKVVLVHGGYPYILEASWLANVLPNVYLELSSPLPPYFAPAVSVRRYVETIQQAPSRKIVYGSDGHQFPEMHWLSARIAKSTLNLSLKQLVELGILDEDDSKEIAEDILLNNVKRLYKLA